MRKTIIATLAALLIAVPALVALAHHVEDLEVSVTCEGWEASASANVFSGHEFRITLDGNTIYSVKPSTTNGQNIETWSGSGPETSGTLAAAVYLPRGGLENGPVSKSFSLEDECQEETTTTLPEETTTTVPEETTTTPEVSTTVTSPPTTVPPPTSTPSTVSVPTSPNPTTPEKPEAPELPFTGIEMYLWAAGGAALLASGGFLVRRFRDER